LPNIIFITKLTAFFLNKNHVQTYNFNLATKPLITIFADVKKNEYEAVTNGGYENAIPKDKTGGGCSCYRCAGEFAIHRRQNIE
jgi:hypothetical protein